MPTNANDLMVITVVKKLGAYIITVTEKSPKKFRGVFVVRMKNYCLDTLENLLEANFIRMDSLENKNKRAEFQKQAIIKLKLLGYISMLAEISGCILKRQYKQISIQVAESINLITAWKKSDDARWNNKK
ncbi:MAG: four helix bundle protein [Bacilli bacterium]|nr:four helix bundle protein [Bacilli bacterium]